MNEWRRILAAGDDGFTTIVEVAIAVIVIVLAVAGKVLKKGPTQEEQEAQRRRWEELRRAREEALGRAEAERKAYRARQQEFQPQTRPQPRAGIAPRPGAGQQRPPAGPPRPPLPMAEPREAEPQLEVLRPSLQAEGDAVEEELRRQAERLVQEERQRRTRLAGPQLNVRSSRGVAGVEAIAGAEGDAYAKRVTVRSHSLVEHLDLQQARMAIIYHEILSPPKSLRQGPESWEL